jgi:hypothetical protein
MRLLGGTVTANATESEVVSSKKRWFPAGRSWAIFSVVLIWATLLPRIIPSLEIDRGIFVSVAERILAGDVLYQDVWDNKDPLFFFGIAIARSVSPFMDIVGEVSWIVCSAFAVLLIAKWRGCDRKTAWFAAFGMAPLIITGGFYLPGYTHLPGIALTLWIVATATTQRFEIVGALLGVLMFTKIVMLPIAFLMLLTIVLVRRNWRAALLALAGFAVAAGAVLALLHFRGELQPYVQSLFLNATYSQGSLVDGRGGPFIRHLIKMASFQTLTVGALLVLTVLWVVLADRRRGTPIWLDRRNLILWASVGSSILGAVIVLGFTGLWKHHAQVLYVAAILAAIGIIHRLQPVFNIRSALPVAAFTGLAMCLSGQASPTAYPESVVKSISSAPKSLASLGSVPSEAQALLSVGNHGTYARVGQNDEFGHAYGLADWDLACPKFHQYPFESLQSLHDVSACISSAQVIIVSPTAVPIAGNASWNAYIASIETTLRAQYSCTPWGVERICVHADS